MDGILEHRDGMWYSLTFLGLPCWRLASCLRDIGERNYYSTMKCLYGKLPIVTRYGGMLIYQIVAA